ncbi:MAG: hypothetical protein BMS9Abin03_005 [Thermodesulfobacteriota bacterium]|nr:MAG: hypothetical protein BMS9Abin03_005 [Thermodesulfobacteriota bacterium]
MKGEGLCSKGSKTFENAPFSPIPAPALRNAKPIPLGSDSNFNPRNPQCIPVVKILVFLGLEQKLTFFKGLVRIINSFLGIEPERYV